MKHFPAGDLPPAESARLKRFAQELAGALVFDLGVDVVPSIFALGQSSLWVGHHLQPLLGAQGALRGGFDAEEDGPLAAPDGSPVLVRMRPAWKWPLPHTQAH